MADAALKIVEPDEFFQWGLARGYDVTGVLRDPLTSRSFYILVKPETA